MDDETRNPFMPTGRGAVIAAALTGLIPFAASFTTTSSRMVNGGVVHFVFRDWIAIGGGALAVVIGVVGLAMALRARAGAIVGGGAVAIAIGGLQLARGFGAFASPPEPAVSAGAPEAPADPATCADKDACDHLAAHLSTTDPKASITASARSCELGQKYACIRVAGAWAGGSLGTDPVKSVGFYLRACDLGGAEGCLEGGVPYFFGKGVDKDPARARTLFEKGCELGSRIACKNLWIIHRDGGTVPADPKKALAYAVHACEEGAPVDTSVAEQIGEACSTAAQTLREGRVAKRDDKHAKQLDEKSFSFDHAACEAAAGNCHNVGVDYDHGIGTAADPAQARASFGKACDAGRAASCNNLGDLLRRGRGGPRDLEAAKRLFGKACEGGFTAACKQAR
jgi:TPR repeat protein